MTISSTDYAALSEDAYRDRRVDPNASVRINGVDYRVLATSDRPSGYQGTIYQRLDTREIVVAHRGTEPTRETMRDVVRTDGGMVVNAVNNQTEDAIALTRRAVELARAEGERSGRQPPVTVTGHSLGGTLAQITAHRFDLHGETFNAYGAASLNLGIPAGGNQVVNHVRASDVVSAASPHHGEVRVYATQQDVDAIRDAGYRNDRSRWDLRNPLEVAWNRGMAAHEIGAFVRAEGGGPLMSADNSRRAQQFDPMIDKYRDDVGAIRSGITNTSQGIQDGVQRLRDGWDRLFSQRADVRESPLVSDNPMLAQTYQALDRAQQRPDSQVVAGIVAGAQREGLGGIDHIAAHNGTLFAIQGRSADDPAARIAGINVDAALRQPLAAHSEASMQRADAARDQPQLAQNTPQHDPAQRDTSQQDAPRAAMRA